MANQQLLADLLERLHAVQREIRDIEQLLASLGLGFPGLFNAEGRERLVADLNRLRDAEQFFHALAEVNFADDAYRFVRAIDGDTIVVEPPRQLARWLKDVHVRL